MNAWISAAGWSATGPVRVSNDDHYCVGPIVEQPGRTTLAIESDSMHFQSYGFLAAVADGMGGYAGGAAASRLVLDVLAAQFYGERRHPTGDATAEQIARYVEQARQTLSEALRRRPELGDAGTTLAGIVLARPDILVVFHVGDSRVLRASGGFVRGLTVDHSVVAADVACGRLSEDDAVSVPGGDALTRSLGLRGNGAPEIQVFSAWEPGDCFLIGTDGWHGLGRGLSRLALRQWLTDDPEPERLVERMIEAAGKADGQDNASVVVVVVGGERSAV